MCGVLALLTDGTSISDKHRAAANAALARMHSRGPDGGGIWEGPGALLGHRRLAIIDLDARASQPMLSADERYVIVFNGEIYNYKTLRRSLEGRGVSFRTESDTEVVLSLFALDGAAMLPTLRGMFAFVIWDRLAKRAFVARDPYGIKPCYVGRFQGGVIVASQVKAILATGLVSREADVTGQAGFWLLGSVPEPHTWFRDIQAIPGGHWLSLEAARRVGEQRWFDIGAAWREAQPIAASDDEIRALAGTALRESVSRHLVSDVPVGVFLSGGIDSGAVAGLIAEAGDATNLEGVTIAFEEFDGRPENEAPVAAKVASHYAMRHTVRFVDRTEFERDLPRILNAMDQPSIDGVNTWYAAKATAERGLKVVASGIGGDELLQGYSHFQQIRRVVETRNRWNTLPGLRPALVAFGRLLAARSNNGRWKHLEQWTRTVEGTWWLRRSLFAPQDLPRLMGSAAASDALKDFDVVDWLQTMTGPLPSDPLLAVGQIESMTYLRNQLLRDSDWASMDHGIELRTPLVDATLLGAFAPLLQAVSRFRGKSLLAEAPKNPLPSEVTKRVKTGFGTPMRRWLDESCSTSTGGSGSRRIAEMVALRCYDDDALGSLKSAASR